MFVRNASNVWHEDVPGARWFKADLHVHTIDDHAGGRARWPAGISGGAEDPDALTRYAHAFLQGAVSAGVKVLGLTPHSPRAGSRPETSSVWRIVEMWNDGVDDEGTPFRDKVFAIFPGFEPNVNDGGSGVHLLFLFDPEIGRDCYLRLFDALMGAREPYPAGQQGLRMSSLDARASIKCIDDQQQEMAREGSTWSYLILAPHPFRGSGLFNATKSQVLQEFPCERLAGFELPDAKIPGDYTVAEKPGSFLLPFMRQNRQAFFHASDAYRVVTRAGDNGEEAAIGARYTWLKLANPRTEAVRQALIASDSRLRIAYERKEDGSLQEASRPPHPPQYPWLRSVTVRGGASFFGGVEDDQPAVTVFDFSPDLTCLIGGSMTGKSTLLDGLRVHMGSVLPNDEKLATQVRERGRNVFLAGSPTVELLSPGADPTAPAAEQWPAQFFTQGELQRLSGEPAAVEAILGRLVPEEADNIDNRRRRLVDLGEQMSRLVVELGILDDELDESEQAHQRSAAAKVALAAFAEAGVARMHSVAATHEVWAGALDSGRTLSRKLTALIKEAQGLLQLSLDPSLAGTPELASEGGGATILELQGQDLLDSLREAQSAIERWVAEVSRNAEALARLEEGSRREVEQALAARGLDAHKLREFDALSQQATLLPSNAANLARVRQEREEASRLFGELRSERLNVVNEQRKALDRVTERVTTELHGRMRVRRIEDGDIEPLQVFLTGLQERGVTRWWNALSDQHTPMPPPASPDILLQSLEGQRLGDLGMSDAVASTFAEVMTRKRQRELAAVHCPDRYVVEMPVGEGEYRRIDELSGGQRVSLLLSLLLETQDDRPLVIDQPEDELDNRFLWDTVLPALRRLKGRRQVIVATHNANIVVNGDADQVILLEADAHHGQVAAAGAIEDPQVRQAIVETVDGGSEAFRLRRLKYGI